MKIPTIKTSKIDIKNYWQNIKTYSVAYLSKINKNDKLYITTNDVFLKNSYRKLILHTIDKQGYGFVYRNTFKNTESFTNRNYEKLSPLQIQAIRSNIPIDMAANAEIIVDTARLIKKIFDKKYGEGNYVFISVGRSFSAVSKCLEYLGNETKRIPFSGVSHMVNKVTVKSIVHQEGFSRYIRFLKGQGLTAEKVKKSPKKFLFCDYAVTGGSINFFKKIMRTKVIGLHSDNIYFLKLNNFLFKETNVYKSNDDKLFQKLLLLEQKLSFQAFDNYSDIHYLECTKLKNINSAVHHPLEERVKKMQFCLLDILHTTKF